MTKWLMPSERAQLKAELPEEKRANSQSLNDPTKTQVKDQRKWARWYSKARATYLRKQERRMNKLPLDIGSPRMQHDKRTGHVHIDTSKLLPIQYGRHIDTLPTNAPPKKPAKESAER
jgi:hypothetical protein